VQKSLIFAGLFPKKKSSNLQSLLIVATP